VAGTLLLEPVRLADRGVEIDREGLRAGTAARRPGPCEELAGHAVELADVAPAEAAQERAEGRRGLDDEPDDVLRAARPERGRVVDAVAAGEGGHDEGEELVAAVGLAGPAAKVEVPVHQLTEAQMLGERGRQQEPRVGHQAVVVEAGVQPVEGVR